MTEIKNYTIPPNAEERIERLKSPQELLDCKPCQTGYRGRNVTEYRLFGRNREDSKEFLDFLDKQTGKKWSLAPFTINNDSVVTTTPLTPLTEEAKKNQQKDLKEVFKNTKVVNIEKDHNQSLDAIYKAKEDGVINKRVHLYNFDTHSDIYRKDENPNDIGIGNWINALMKDETVKDVTWVLPKWTKDKDAEETFWEQPADLSVQFLKGQKDQTAYIDRETKKITFNKPADYDDKKYRTVGIHKKTAEELKPPKDDEDVVLSIDADYFSNYGPGTVGGHESKANATYAELQQKLNKFSRLLKAKGFKPKVVTMSLSPGYTPPEDLPVIRDYFKDIVSATSAKKETINIYKRDADHTDPRKSYGPIRSQTDDNSLYKD